jgi:succinate dehydrogenase / fumarate reductase membrane anchor subunit
MKKSTSHWFMQRLSAILLILLSYWLFAFLHACLDSSYADIIAWMNTTPNRTALIVWFLVVCYHSALGLHVVVEDYITQSRQSFLRQSINLFFCGIALSAVVLVVDL